MNIYDEHKILSKINSIEDLKQVNPADYKRLAAEVRGFLVRHLSQTGGHLASNLGVVELTMALHIVFNSPVDKIIWDVGHQSYVHKMFTGRKDKFSTLRQLHGLSGFPTVSESHHDAFGTGHSSTSVSAGLGMAKARDLKNEDNHVVAVIGDGAITSGLAYEGLNNAGFMQLPMIIVFNDNEMSISENVGGLSKQINHVRFTQSYLEAKKEVGGLLDDIPVIGKPIKKVIEKIKDSAYQLFVPDDFFKGLNIRYYGPVDGHDTVKLIEALENIKKIDEPVLLHVKTVKGKGYEPAEKGPQKFHGVSAFHVESGQEKKQGDSQTYAAVFGETMVELAKTDKRIVAITAAMPDGTGLSQFARQYPNQFLDVGIAEAHGVTMAGGLALSGMKPVFAIYSTFVQRAYDQLIHDIAIQNLPMVLAIDRAGIVGADGETHQGLFDLTMLFSLPNFEILAPRDGNELRQMLLMAINRKNPVGIRYPRGSAAGVSRYPSGEVIWGVGEVLEEGKGVAIVSVGAMLEQGVDLYNRLLEVGYQPKLIHMGFLKEKAWLENAVKNCDTIITIEENILSGGFGSYVRNLEIAGIDNCITFGIQDQFIPQGTRDELLDLAGLTGEKMFRAFIEKQDKQHAIKPSIKGD